MPLIEFKKITHNLSDESFDKIKRITESYISYYFVGIEETDKNLYLEKIGEYFKNFENHNKKIRDNDIAQMYVSELASLMKNRAKPGSYTCWGLSKSNYWNRKYNIQCRCR